MSLFSCIFILMLEVTHQELKPFDRFLHPTSAHAPANSICTFEKTNLYEGPVVYVS